MSQVDEIYSLLVKYSNSYYNSGVSLISDEEFDRLQKLYEQKSGKSFQYLGKSNNNRAKLPCWMGSLAKCKDDHALGLFLKRTEAKKFIVSEKVDGVSLLFYRQNGTTKLYTRGDGLIGSDISHLEPYLKFPKINEDILVRGELVLKKENYKFLDDTEIPRNFVSGLINSKTIEPKNLQLLDFIAYSIPNSNLKPSQIFKLLFSTLGFQIPKIFEISKDCVTHKYLCELLKSHISDYEIDGLVVSEDASRTEEVGEDPKFTIAFKIDKEPVKTIVKEVIWQSCRFGLLYPKVTFNTVKIDDVNISNATAFHAKYIKDNNIGPGAEIKIIRSGDVIPKIVEVTKPTQPQFPTIPFEWVDDIHIKASQENSEQIINKFVYFMDILGAKGVKDGVIAKMLYSGLNTFDKILFATKKELLTCDGVAEKLCEKISQSLQIAQSNLDLVKLLVGTSLFKSLGEKKMSQIVKRLKPQIINVINRVDEIDEKTWTTELEKDGIKAGSEVFIQGINSFLNLNGIERCLELALTNSQNKVQKENVKLSGKTFVFSGYRNKELESKLEESGHKIGSTVSKTTTAVVVNDKNSSSSKSDKAKDLGIPVILENELKKYL